MEISTNGIDWTPWSTLKNDAYKGYLNEGQDELDKLSGIKPRFTLTLYVHDGNRDGPVIHGAQVTGHDGSGSSFEQSTDSSGYVTIPGDSGTWSFTASADGYKTNSWDQELTEECTRHAYLQSGEDQQESKNEPPIDSCWTCDETQKEETQQESIDLGAPRQNSDNSVVGKWAFHFIRKSWTSSDERVIKNSNDEWDTTVDCSSDGTYTESTSYGTWPGEWIPVGDTIRFQSSNEFSDYPDGYIFTHKVSEGRDGRIEGNTMSGKGRRHTQTIAVGDDSYTADIDETYSWSASRVG